MARKIDLEKLQAEWREEVADLARLPQEELVVLSLDALQPSVRLQNLFLNADRWETIGEVCESSASDICKYRSFVKRTVLELEVKLEAIGLSLREET